MSAYRVVGAVGRTLMTAGVLILLFVAHQLWGTGIREAQAQRELTRDFEAALLDAGATWDDQPVIERPPEPPHVEAPPPAPEGEAVAIMRIPSIGLEKAVVSGVSVGALKKGPGHYPDTPLPGQPGNAAVAGHRTTYGAPFYSLDELDPGDEILVTTRQGRFRYEVTETIVVRPDQVEVLDPTEDDRLTLTTCHPRFSARQRLIVVAHLTGEAAPAPPTTLPAEPDELEELADPADDERPDSVRRVLDEDAAGLSGDPAARGPAAAWAALAAGIWLAAWLVGRCWRRWPAYLVGTPIFLVVLFMFYENVARLLPANI